MTAQRQPIDIHAELRSHLAKHRGNAAMAVNSWDTKLARRSDLRFACWDYLFREALQDRDDEGHSKSVGDDHPICAPSSLPHGEGVGPALVAAEDGGQSLRADLSPPHEDVAGQVAHAHEGLGRAARTSSPLGDDGGQMTVAENGHRDLALSSPLDRDEVGHQTSVDEGQSAHANLARDPSPEAVEAAIEVKLQRYNFLWENFEMRHNFNLRKTRFSELFGLRDRGFEIGWIAEQIIANHPHADPDTYLGYGNDRLLTDAELADYIKTAERKVRERNPR